MKAIGKLKTNGLKGRRPMLCSKNNSKIKEKTTGLAS